MLSLHLKFQRTNDFIIGDNNLDDEQRAEEVKGPFKNDVTHKSGFFEVPPPLSQRVAYENIFNELLQPKIKRSIYPSCAYLRL